MKSATYLLLHGLALTSYASTIEVTANVSIPPPVSGYFQLEKKVTDDIQYDNLTASALPVVGSGVGTYEYITYNAFTLLDGSDDVVGGVAIHTLPNAIDTTSEQQGTNGTPSLAVAKPYTSIGLVDFWFGCSTHTGESLANLATQCSVTVAAYQSSSDKQVALAVFEFTPPAVR